MFTVLSLLSPCVIFIPPHSVLCEQEGRGGDEELLSRAALKADSLAEAAGGEPIHVLPLCLSIIGRFSPAREEGSNVEVWKGEESKNSPVTMI